MSFERELCLLPERREREVAFALLPDFGALLPFLDVLGAGIVIHLLPFAITDKHPLAERPTRSKNASLYPS